MINHWVSDCFHWLTLTDRVVLTSYTWRSFCCSLVPVVAVVVCMTGCQAWPRHSSCSFMVTFTETVCVLNRFNVSHYSFILLMCCVDHSCCMLLIQGVWLACSWDVQNWTATECADQSQWACRSTCWSQVPEYQPSPTWAACSRCQWPICQTVWQTHAALSWHHISCRCTSQACSPTHFSSVCRFHIYYTHITQCYFLLSFSIQW